MLVLFGGKCPGTFDSFASCVDGRRPIKGRIEGNIWVYRFPAYPRITEVGLFLRENPVLSDYLILFADRAAKESRRIDLAGTMSSEAVLAERRPLTIFLFVAAVKPIAGSETQGSGFLDEGDNFDLSRFTSKPNVSVHLCVLEKEK